MASTSPGYAVTVRVQCPTSTDSTSQLTTAVTRAGGSLTALDVVESHHDTMVVDVTCDATDQQHALHRAERLRPDCRTGCRGRDPSADRRRWSTRPGHGVDR